MRNVFIWLVINAVSAFNLKCPHAGEWNHTAEARNCSSTNYYCLFDDVKLKNAANCSTEPRTERKGFKTVLNKGNFNRKACSLNNFQPFQFSSYKNSECVLEKSLCSEEGQVLADTGTAEIDRSCRCDYVKGYAFLANTSNLCSCIPSEEDCTCFKKPCSIKEILSQDYKCIKKTELQGIHQCTSISDRESIKPAIDVATVPLKVYNKVLSVLVVCRWKQTKRKIWHVLTYLRNCYKKIIIIKHLEDQSCFEGDAVTFTFEVNQDDIPGRWSKDRMEIKPSEFISIAAVGKVHVLVIHSVTATDSGEYVCHILDKNSSAQLTVKEVVIVKPLKDQNCSEEGSVTFTCEVNQNDIPARWSKDGMEIKPSESISIAAVGKEHKLVIHRVTATDSGEYVCHILDKKSSAQLTVKEVFIIKHLEDQNCFEGGSVTFTCVVNKTNIPGKWKKDGQELEPSESISIAAVGRILTLVIHSVTANDSGNYSLHIRNDDSSAQLIVSEVMFIKKFKDQKCFEGETVTFTIVVNHENVPGKWIKDGMELESSESKTITVNGRTHNLVIHSVTLNDKGYYSFKVSNKASGVLLIIEDTKYIKLCHLLKSVAEPVVRKIFDREIHPDYLKNTLSKGKNKIDWLKKHRHINWREYDLLYPKVVEISVKFKIINHDYNKIQGNKEEDKRIRAEILNDVSALFNSVQGIHKVEILDLESGSLITVLKLTASQNFEKTLKSTIESAVKEGKIGSFETDSDEFIFQRVGNLQVPVTSQNFDIRLMMILMKNLIEAYVNIPDVLPFETDITEVADLSRVKHIRNKIVQNSDRSISDEDFEEDWSNLSQALIRLGGESVAEECKTLKEYQPTPQQSKDYLNPENLQCDQGSISNESLTDDFVQETLMNNSARYAVRQIFDKQFPPQALQKEIENQKQPLRNLKEHRGITQSQWDDLFPREKESLSSARFDIKVMIILLSNTSFKDKEIFKTIENLQNCLSRPKEYRKAIMQAIKEINEEELSWR